MLLACSKPRMGALLQLMPGAATVAAQRRDGVRERLLAQHAELHNLGHHWVQWGRISLGQERRVLLSAGGKARQARLQALRLGLGMCCCLRPQLTHLQRSPHGVARLGGQLPGAPSSRLPLPGDVLPPPPQRPQPL